MLKELWYKLAGFFDVRSFRERILFCVGIAFVIYGFFNILLFMPANSRLKNLSDKMNAAQGILSQQKDQLAQLVEQAKANSSLNESTSPEALRDEIKGLHQQIKQSIAKIKSQKEITNAFKTVLQETPDLELLSFKSKPAEQLTVVAGMNVVKKSWEIKLRGNYFSILRYLQTIESLNLYLFWDGIDYQVQTYPQAEVTLKIYLLTTAQGI